MVQAQPDELPDSLRPIAALGMTGRRGCCAVGSDILEVVIGGAELT
jgi:hypothetical protein